MAHCLMSLYPMLSQQNLVFLRDFSYIMKEKSCEIFKELFSSKLIGWAKSYRL